MLRDMPGTAGWQLWADTVVSAYDVRSTPAIQTLVRDLPCHWRSRLSLLLPHGLRTGE